MKQAGYVPSYVRENLTVLGAFGRRLERWALRVEDLDELFVWIGAPGWGHGTGSFCHNSSIGGRWGEWNADPEA